MIAKPSTIGELLDCSGGSIKTGPFGTKLKASEYTATGVPVISVGEVGFGRLQIHEKTPRVDKTVWSRMPEFLLSPGDIVFGRKGAVQRSAQALNSAREAASILEPLKVQLQEPTG
jgi:type I restriction enzyme, S subunit